MSVKPFQGIPNIQELSCSGQALDADSTLSSMILFTAADDKIVAQANIVSKECSTTGVFTSCVLHATDTRRTLLRTLVMDLQRDQTRRYGCEISSVRSGERAKTQSWFFEVTGRSKWSVVRRLSLQGCGEAERRGFQRGRGS